MSGIWGNLLAFDVSQAQAWAQSWLPPATPTKPPAAPQSPGTLEVKVHPQTLGVDILSNIEKWAPVVLAAFTALYCLFKETSGFAIGLSLAIYQKRYPDHLVGTLSIYARRHISYKERKFGWLSIVLESPTALVSAVALTAMWFSDYVKRGIPIYFTFVVASTFLSPQPKQ